MCVCKMVQTFNVYLVLTGHCCTTASYLQETDIFMTNTLQCNVFGSQFSNGILKVSILSKFQYLKLKGFRMAMDRFLKKIYHS